MTASVSRKAIARRMSEIGGKMGRGRRRDRAGHWNFHRFWHALNTIGIIASCENMA